MSRGPYSYKLRNPRQVRHEARHYYKSWDTKALVFKRARLVTRLLAVEQLLLERGRAALPAPMVATLRIMSTPPTDEDYEEA